MLEEDVERDAEDGAEEDTEEDAEVDAEDGAEEDAEEDPEINIIKFPLLYELCFLYAPRVCDVTGHRNEECDKWYFCDDSCRCELLLVLWVRLNCYMFLINSYAP